MYLNEAEKNDIKHELVEQLQQEKEIKRIVVFGSFLNSDNPNDIDIAIFQTTSEKYLPLALKYRGLLDRLASRISLDILPLKFGNQNGYFMDEINSGEVLYEKC